MTTTRLDHVELRDPLHGPIRVSRAELAVIDSPHFQRLRRVKQLGFAEHAFPGAVHNRYLHSLGAMHLAGRLFDALAQSAPWLTGPEGARLRQTVRFAALLHDIGHPPLSHAAEALLPDRSTLPARAVGALTGRASHEDMTMALVLASGLTEILARAGAPEGVTPEAIAALIESHLDSGSTFVIDGVNLRPLLHSVVSGELDVDRMDYLLRDSLFAGVSYGHYDLDWLVSQARAVPDGDVVRLGIDQRALPAFEHFLLARYHMFQMVYFHPKSDIYDAMLRQWLSAVGDEARFPGDPEAFVACDDAWLRSRLLTSDNPWAIRIAEDRPLALAAELRHPLDAATESRVAALLATEPEAVRLTARPVLSRYAQKPSHLRADPLLVIDASQRVQRIEEVTDLYDRYERTLRLERVYVPRERRDAARERLASR
ncbi:MAG: HD domain-containing protein [Myxococcota bacterium]